MVSTGNKSKLVNSEYCQTCARCCRELVLGGFDLDSAIRFLWLDTNRIKATDSVFRDEWGAIKRDVTFKFPCNKLVMESGKYCCTKWNEDRPEFCNTFPDNLFYGIDTWDSIKIEKMLEEGSKICPYLKKISVAQVQEMLTRLRDE